MTQHELIEGCEFWTLPLTGRRVTQCSVDYAVTLTFGDSGDAYYLSIEDALSLRLSGGEEAEIMPGGPTSKLGPVLRVLHESVECAVAFKSGHLEISFTGSIGLRVAASTRFEAWSLTGPTGLRIVSLPGGELAVWEPDARRG